MGTGRGVTVSSVISFVERLEDDSTAFYEELADRYDRGRDVFLSFADGSRKNKRAIVRTYRETVSDALETGFSFPGLELDAYDVDTELEEDAGFDAALDKALALERLSVDFYLEAAQGSRSLLATIPMAFKSAAKRREKRQEQLQAMRAQGSGNT